MALRKFVQNAGWNVVGQTVPLLAALIVLPHLIRLMGLERYGFLTLVWVLVGYAGLFDFGIGRAVTRTVASRLAAGDAEGARHVSMVGMTYMLAFGTLVGLVFAALSPWLSVTAFKIPVAMHGEAIYSLLLLGVSIPMAMLSTGYGAVLNAYQRFGALNVVRAALGVATYFGPLVVVWYANRLEFVVGFIAVMRFLSNRAYALICHRQCGVKFWPVMPDKPTSRELFSLGGWITVSNVISPLLTYLDRLILGSLVAIQAVAYYATPYDIVMKSLIVPYSIMGAIFPIAAGLTDRGPAARTLFLGSVRSIYLIMLPLELCVFVLGPSILHIWLGADFATNGGPVVRCLAVGLLLNALAQVPAMMIQAAGKPKWMAILHMVELPVFIVLLWMLTMRLGITGTALAAALRFGVDGIILYVMALRGITIVQFDWKRTAMHVMVAVALFAGALAIPSLGWAPLVYLPLAVACFACYAWLQMLETNEKSRVLQHLRAATVGGL